VSQAGAVLLWETMRVTGLVRGLSESLAGLRAEEAAMMGRADVHFGRGPFGKLHVRFGKGAKTSGPRPRWVPMLDGPNRRAY
jgi:hypothetical protein